MQAGEWGEYLERTDFEFENGKATLMDSNLICSILNQNTLHKTKLILVLE